MTIAHPPRRSTRHHVVDERFAALLEEDYGIRTFHVRALIGVPCRQAMAICSWAESRTEDVEERGEAVDRWARKRRVGRYSPAANDPTPATFGGEPPRGV